MVFVREDIYTSSGSVMLYNSWTPYVSKFDTSSFYNWEQDNLPLYDLEERTYELWEQAGFPTSAIPGFSLTVSGDAPAATLLANSNIFTTVSSCIAALPKVIRFPILIEVANLGDLGKLELHNFKIEEAGSIEIINRAYSKVYNASGYCSQRDATPAYNKYTPLVKQFISADVSATLFSGIDDNACTSGVHISTRVLTEGGAGAGITKANSFLYPKHTLRKAPLSVSLEYNGLLAGVLNEFNVSPYEVTVDQAQDATIQLNDVSAAPQSGSTTKIKRADISTGVAQDVGGSIYLNALSKLSIKNCDGPIFVRNFCVNGQSAPNEGRDVGVEVTNSDVLLENCAATRCKEAGFKFNNSKVVLSRSAFSYRNYTLTAADTRNTKTGIGFHAINSDVSISALLPSPGLAETGAGEFQASGDDVMVIASRNYIGFKLDNSKLHGGYQRTIITSEPTGGITSAEVNTGFGIVCNNSNIDIKGLLDVYGNNEGIELNNSNLEYDELCVEDHPVVGLRARNSLILLRSHTGTPGTAGQAVRKQVDFVRNGQHLDLQKQSVFRFNLVNHMPDSFGCMSFSGAQGVIKWSDANKGILPAISVDDDSILDLIQPKIITRIQADSVAGVPAFGQAIKATNNSTVSLYGTAGGCNFVWGTPGYTYQKHSAGLYADNESTINLHGPTVIAQFGVDALVEDQSTLNIEPSRVRDKYTVEASGFDLSAAGNHTSVELHATRACLVANKNSTINMLDLGAYSQTWEQSPNGVIVLADGTDYPIGTYDNSSLICSGSLQFYPNPQDANAITENYLDDLTNASHPNTITIGAEPVFTNGDINTFLVTDTLSSPDYAKRSTFSKGGVCVRATQDSVVNVRNVHFPLAHVDNPLDGVIYNCSSTECDQLMIWNMADTSRLNASFCSLSGMYPLDAQYHGPSSLWMSSVDGTLVGLGKEVPASGALENTPDTGSLSILDAFGAGSAVWVIPSGVTFNMPFDRFESSVADSTVVDGVAWGAVSKYISQAGINVIDDTPKVWGAAPHTSNNRGNFRIYWSPKSSAKLLQTDLSGYYHGSYPHTGDFSGALGPAYQVFSQGYNCSAPLSAILPVGLTNVSGLYPNLLKQSYSTGTVAGVTDRLWTSGFYYCEDFVDSNPTQTMLDESASNTFANSKNASLGLGGRPVKVTLYRSRGPDSRGSEAYPGDASGSFGFKSSNIFDLARDN